VWQLGRGPRNELARNVTADRTEEEFLKEASPCSEMDRREDDREPKQEPQSLRANGQS
jgi:hypothetical protein